MAAAESQALLAIFQRCPLTHCSASAPARLCSAAQRADVGAYLNTTANAIASVLSGVGTVANNATLVAQAQVRPRWLPVMDGCL